LQKKLEKVFEPQHNILEAETEDTAYYIQRFWPSFFDVK